jgi:hypothetical protein
MDYTESIKLLCQVTKKGVEEYNARTRKEADEKFSNVLGWVNGAYVGTDENNLYVEMQDSGRERGEFKAVSWCYVNDELGKASKISKAALEAVLQRLTGGNDAQA